MIKLTKLNNKHEVNRLKIFIKPNSCNFEECLLVIQCQRMKRQTTQPAQSMAKHTRPSPTRTMSLHRLSTRLSAAASHSSHATRPARGATHPAIRACMPPARCVCSIINAPLCRRGILFVATCPARGTTRPAHDATRPANRDPYDITPLRRRGILFARNPSVSQHISNNPTRK